MWLPLITAGLLVWAGVIAVIIILQRRSAAATLAWLLVLMFLPVIGLLVYRLIGPLRLSRKKTRRALSRQVVAEAMAARAALEDHELEHRQLAQVAIDLGEAGPLRAHEVEVFLDGVAAYAALFAAIEAATHHIHLEYYIWEPDAVGTALRDRLVARARAGVQVRMIIDGTGSHGLSRRFLAPLRDAGVEVAWFNPLRLRFLQFRRADFRTHRKIVVCDGRVGFTGGMNICDEHSAAYGPDYWRDTHVRISGAAVWPLQRMFVEDWMFAAERLIAIDPASFPLPEQAGEHLVQIVGSGPDSDAFAVHKVLFTAINQSTDRLWVTTPYFVPDDAMLTALITAALRDVDVRLIVPSRGDSRIIDLAARSYFAELLAAGVRVFEYQTRFIHAKTMVCDDDVAVIGTANLDNRSFRLNFEVIAVLYGTPSNAALADAFTADLHDSRELTRSEFDAQPLGRRFSQASARLLSPLL